MTNEERATDLGSAPRRVTAVVVVWNSGNLAIDLLRGLEEAFAAGMRAVLVDNASADGSFDLLRGFLDGWVQGRQVELVQSGDNIGFTAGVNLATDRALAAAAPPEFVWMLNPDATAAPAAVEMLVAVADASGGAVVTTTRRAYVPRNSWPRPFFTRFKWAQRGPEPWIPVGLYNGACALFTSAAIRELIERTGHFQDPALFMDWDEWDCARRLHARGREIIHARDIPFSHPEGLRTLGSTPGARLRQYYQGRNPIVVSRRYMPAWQFWLVLPVHLARDLSWFLRLKLRGVEPNTSAYLAGVRDALRGKVGRWEHHPPGPSASR